MKRRTAVVVAGCVGLGLGALVVVLSTQIAGERGAARHDYDTALFDQRQAASAEDRARDATEPQHSRTIACVDGVATFASAAAGSLERPLVRSGRLDLDALRWVSSQAIRGERRAERAAAGPALPQRMGRRRDPATGQWSHLEPPRKRCGDGEAYASLDLDQARPELAQSLRVTGAK
jgi:hypothetical protein